jgi:hypothetical protein
MKFFATRREYELVEALAKERLARIVLLEKQNEELKMLFNKTSEFEIVEQAEDTIKLRTKTQKMPDGSFVRGGYDAKAEQRFVALRALFDVRGGYRAKAEHAASRTHSRDNDSVGNLQRRTEEN